MKLSFISSSPSIKTDVFAIRYTGGHINPYFNSVPLLIIVPPFFITSRRSYYSFKRHLEELYESGPSVEAFQIDLGLDVKYERGSKFLLSNGLKRFKKYLEEWYFEPPEIIISTMNKTWLTEKALSFLRSLKVTLTTHYLENELIAGGWANDFPSKREPKPLLTFEPVDRGKVHIVLWGTYGVGWGSYCKETFIQNFTKKMMQASRYYGLKKIWIDLRNDMGRIDRPFPVAEIKITIPEEQSMEDLVISMAVPRGVGIKTKPSNYDRIKILEEWERQKLVLDGLR